MRPIFVAMRLRFVVLYLFIPLLGFAQQFVTLPSAGVFPETMVKTLFQDAEGYMWYGTGSGLYRYDGYNVVPIRLYPMEHDGVNFIVEPRPGSLWLGTNNGLFVLDKGSFKVHELPLKEVKGKNITSLYVATDRSVYIGVRGALLQVSPEERLLDKFTIKSHGVYCEVHSISELPDGSPLFCMDWEGLCHLDRKKHRIVNIPQEASCNTILRDDVNHCYWVGTWGQGILCYDPATGKFLKEPALVSRGKDMGKVIGMMYDKRFNYLWVVMLDNLYVFRVHAGTRRLEPVSLSTVLPFGRKMLTYILKDRNDNIWLPSTDGNNLLISTNKVAMQQLPMEVWQERTGYVPLVTSLYKGEDGYLWFSSERGGLCLYDERSGRFVSYKENAEMARYPFLFTSRLTGSHIRNKVWVASYNYTKVFGVSHDGDRLKLDEIIDLEQYDKNVTPVQSLYEAEDGCLWLGTSKDVWVYEPRNRTARRVCITKEPVTGFAEQPDEMWFCCRNNGIFRVRKPHVFSGKREFLMYSLKKDFSCIASQPDGSLLLGTEKGEVYHFYVKDKKGILVRYRYIAEQDGKINDIRIDGEGNCWLLSGRQLRRYYVSDGQFYNYGASSDPSSGVSVFYSMALYGGKTYIGGRGGILSADASERPVDKEQAVSVRVSDIKVNRESILSDEEQDGALSYADGRVELKADSRNVQFSFSTLDLLNSSRIQYAYRLKGVDEEWNYTKIGDNTAFYNKLDKGRYTLEVRATDANGVWGKTVATLTVVRLPEWYETWWAYTLWALAGAGLVVFVWNLNVQKIKRENEAELAKRVADMKLRYYTNISHDLLTPLTTTGCVVDELEREGTADKHLLKLMRVNMNYLKRLLQQVLDFRKLERGGMKLNVSYGNLTTFARGIVETGFLALAQQKHIAFHFLSSPEEVKGYFDAEKLDRILYNLCSNALKYTPGNKDITLSVELKSPYAELTVKDTGIGIASSELPHIFQRFYNNRKASPGSSHGIGLSMVKELVELHHGTISVESKEGVGSAFHVRLPITKGSYQPDEIQDNIAGLSVSESIDRSVEAKLSKPLASPASVPAQEPYTLLLVEDNASLLEIMQRLFSANYHVLTAGNGREALEVLKQKDVDIMVSDVMMPEMDGVELCKAVRADRDICHILIVLLTAKTQSKYQVEYYRAGADAYVAKPFDTAVLQSHLETLLRNRKSRQENFKSSTVLSITPLETSDLDKTFLQDALRLVEAHISDASFGVQELADSMNMSRSSLVRKLKKLTGQPPLAFVRNIKMKQACLLLKNKDISIGEIVLKLGYNDVRYFAKSFKEEFGMVPTDYRKRFL